jgi:hypothetical protein
MMFAIFFTFWRFMQIVTLIPTMGMLAWFVDGYVKRNELTPNYILVLFIVSVLALAWAIFTLFSYHRSSANAMFVAIVDLGFVGAFIAGVWYLRGITKVDCTNVSRDANWVITFGDLGSISGPDLDITTDKPCAMLKANFAFGIMNCIMFFFTAVLAWMHGDRLAPAVTEKRHHRETHYHHNHRRRRSGSRRSSHSRRVYV